MQFRFAVPADAAALAPLNQQLIRDEGHRNPMNLAQLEARLRGWLEDAYRALLAEEGGEIVAYALFRGEADCVYIRHLVVAPAQRRAGLGRALVVRVWQLAPLGARLRIDVLAGNLPAQRFWHAVGFQDYAITMETGSKLPDSGPHPAP